jgi:hypothetical protein
MRKNLILNHRAVVKHKDSLDGHGRHFGQKESPECIGDGGVYADQVEFHFEVVEGLDVDAESVSKSVAVPCCLFARAVAGVVGAADLTRRWRRAVKRGAYV